MGYYALKVGLFAGIGSFLLGYDTGIITTSIAHDSFKKYMDNPNAPETGAIVASYIAGEAVGAIIQSVLGDRLGRKHFIQLMCILVTIGSVIQTAAQNYPMFVAGRILTGIAVGGLVGIVPIYNSEISPPSSRGMIGGLPGSMFNLGLCLSNWVGYACGFASNSSSFQWRFPLALQIPPGVILLLGSRYVLPESPRWLIRCGRDEDAWKAFERVHMDTVTEWDTRAGRREFEGVRKQILYEKSTEIASFREAWRKYRKRVAVAVFLNTMTSLTGVNVIGYYQSIIYRALGITGQKTLLLIGFAGTVGFLMGIVSVLLLDRLGRRKMLLQGTALLVLNLIYLAVMTRYFSGPSNKVGSGFAILGLYTFSSICPLFLNSTAWLYGVEVLPLFLRSKITGLATFIHYVLTVAVAQAGPSAFANIGENYYYVFAATNSVFFLGIFFFFPETKGKTLEIIAADFGDKVVITEGEVRATGGSEDEKDNGTGEDKI